MLKSTQQDERHINEQFVEQAAVIFSLSSPKQACTFLVVVENLLGSFYVNPYEEPAHGSSFAKSHALFAKKKEIVFSMLKQLLVPVQPQYCCS